MEPNQIKQAHILDILFEGRNKEYGAYALRKSYNRRIVKAIFAMLSVVGLLFLAGAVSGFGKGKKMAPVDVSDVSLKKVPDAKVVVIPPPKVQPVVQVATIHMSTTRIVPDDQVKPDEKPPENSAADNVQIANVTKAGVESDVVGPVLSDGPGSGIIEGPKKTEPDEPLMVVEIDASYPGGMPAWGRFLNKSLRYPEDAINNGISGTVLVQFVVDLDGNVSDVKVISGPEQGGLREEAMRVILRSGKWVPAIQNGRHVKAYRRQPVTFVKSEDN